MSIRYKIALLFAFLVTIMLSVISIAVYFFSAKDRRDTFQTRLKNRAQSTAKVYASLNDSDLSVLLKMDRAAVASLYNKSVTIVGFNNKHVYLFSDEAGDSMYLASKTIERTKIEDEYFFAYKNKQAVAIHHIDDNTNFIVSVSAIDIDGREYLAQLKSILITALIMAVLFSYLAGLFFARNLIQPIKRITGEVNLITSSNLAQRIRVNKAKDELNGLALTFNNLLDRLQDSFAIQRRFISNASHELSTPLTSISTQLEVALQKNRTEAEYRDVLKSVQEDIKEMQQLTRSLLDIAKAGSQGGIDLTEVRMDEVLFKVVSEIQKQNNSFKVNLDFKIFPDDEKLLTVFGNQNLLYIALKNIIENGCKYSANNQSDVSWSFDKSSIFIRVANKGDIISEADIQNIFQPFFRTSSAQNKPGFGLGLTLTKRILSLHKGDLTVESTRDAGTVFTVTLPNIM